MSYVDTSVIVAALDRLDPRRASLRGVTSSPESIIATVLVVPDTTAVTSP